MESDRSVTGGDGGKEGYRVTVSTLMTGAGTVSETLVSFNTITRLSVRDFTVFSRRESFKTQNKNLLAYKAAGSSTLLPALWKNKLPQSWIRRCGKSGHPKMFVTDK